MKSWIFICLLGVASAHEYFLTKNQSDLIFDGHYLTELNNKGKAFWICVDYEAVDEVLPRSYGNRFPLIQCGGSPRTEKDMYWYVIHGIWEDENKLSIRFKSRYQLWPEYGSTNPSGSFFWTRRTVDDEDNHFRVIQTHGITNYGQKRPDIDTLLLLGGGSVHVKGVVDGTIIHVRIKSEAQTGIALEKVVEAKYDHGNHIIEEEITESPTNSEEEDEEVVTKAFEVYHASRTASESTEEVAFNTTDQSYNEKNQKEDPDFVGIVHIFPTPPENEGIQSRPTEDIPFVLDSVYDETPQSPQSQPLFEFKNEISEETTTDRPTENLPPETTVDETNYLEFERAHESIVRLSQEDDYQTFYTVAIGTALGFLCLFILIVLLRLFNWGSSPDKVNSYSPQTQQQKHVIYTIGGMNAALPIKVAT